MTTCTPETLTWLLGNIFVQTVTDGGESAVTLTVTTPAAISDARAALATLATALQQAASERRAVTTWTS